MVEATRAPSESYDDVIMRLANATRSHHEGGRGGHPLITQRAAL
jgi:hypothetical protein